MNLIDIPPSDDEDDLGNSRQKAIRKIVVQGLIGLLVAVTISFSLAGTITIGDGENFELGQRNYDVGTCATGPVQIIPKTSITETGTVLLQFTVSGISPTICNGRIIRILPFDGANSPIPFIDTADEGASPDQTFVDIFIEGGEFLAVAGGSTSVTTDTTLSLTSGSASIRKSSFSSGFTTVDVYAAGKGRTLKSTDSDLDKLAIAFQVRISPAAGIPSYGRTDVEISTP